MYRIKKVDQNYAEGFLWQVDNPREAFIIQKYINFLFGWVDVRDPEFSRLVLKFDSEKKAIDYLNKLNSYE